jgi:hypothetical protein
VNQAAKVIWGGKLIQDENFNLRYDGPCLTPRVYAKLLVLRPDVKKAREDAGADVSSTTVITPIW